MSSRVDLATEAHWGFLDRADLVRGIRRQAAQGASLWQADEDDMFQEVCLWLSVRPEMHDWDTPLILSRTRSRIQSVGRKRARVLNHEVPLEPEDDDVQR